MSDERAGNQGVGEATIGRVTEGYQRRRPFGGWWLYHLTWHRFPKLHNWLYWRGDHA